ncbi:UDP-N-acetylmuramate dehydrogenase [Patescibacteria group bacterium]|nr:UDP-N-acetylmuramate dehydrogenase [Patescibacteria group bacterium]
MVIETKIERHKPLAPLTTFGIGGMADYFLHATSPEELIAGLEWAKKKKLPVKVFGSGSNSFFADETHHCLVIRNLGGKIKKTGPQTIVAETGTPLMLMINTTNKAGLGGIEKMAGIPGTIGGAVVGNAGAYGTCIGNWVNRVEIWDGQTKHWLNKKDCQFDYRESIFKKQPWFVLRIELKLEKKDPAQLETASDECDQTRHGRYPKGTKGPGCYFKNIVLANLTTEQQAKIPPEIIKGGKFSTGWLIEQAGLKGKKVGDIQVANFHANFIINTGRGSAKDVLALVKIVQETVKEKFGFQPEPEARLL